MPNDKNENARTAGGSGSAPKKADIIIKNTQNIVAKQQDLTEQSRIAVARIEEAIDLFTKSSAEATRTVKLNEEIFTRLQEENSSLKQELLYLAKQSENIYAGLAEKINELSEREKEREENLADFSEKLNAFAGQTERDERSYALLEDRLALLADQNRRNEELYTQLNAKLAALNPAEAYAKVPAAVEVDNTAVLDKLGEISDRLQSEPYGEPVYEGADTEKLLSEISRLSEQLKHSENAHSMLADKFEILSMRVEQYALENSKAPQAAQPAYSETLPEVDYDKLAAKLADVLPVSEPSAEVEIDYDKLAAKLADVLPAQPVSSAEVEVDYDKLAAKVADVLALRDAVSPDYIASKVAEQIVIPEPETSVNVSVDAEYIANKVIEHLAAGDSSEEGNDELVEKVARRVKELAAEELATAANSFDEEGFADKLAEKIAYVKTDEDALYERISQKIDEITLPEPVAELNEEELAKSIAEKLEVAKTDEAISRTVDIDEELLADRLAEKLAETSNKVDEDELAERVARKVSVLNVNAAPAVPNIEFDEEELADSISLKVGSLKAEDFEILVDDGGCSSISKSIVESLDYDKISGIIADKLREVLDLAAVNAPDYEEMAERISEKITVAGINEDAIADKAAAVLSNYLPDFDSDEITDKITGAVIDVVSAISLPTIDSDGICNTITERLIESQENHDYDVVIDDDGISRICEVVSDDVRKGTDARFDKVEEDITAISEVVAKIKDYVEYEQSLDGNTETVEEVHFADGDYDRLSELVATEIERGTAYRFDKVEGDLAKLADTVNSITTVEETEPEEYEDEYYEEDYTALSEVVASEIEKGVSSRLDAIEENLTHLSELITTEEEELEEEGAEEEKPEAEGEELPFDKDVISKIFNNISTAVATEVEKRVTYRLFDIEENVAKISDILDSKESLENKEVEEAEDSYAKLSEIVASEIEKGVSYRLDSLEENLSKLSPATDAAVAALTVGGLSDSVNTVSEQVASVSEQVAKIYEYIESEKAEVPEEPEEVTPDYAELSDMLANEVERRVAYRFESLEENIAKITDVVTAEPEEDEPEEVEEVEEVTEPEEAVEPEEDYTALSEVVASEVERRVSSRLDTLEEGISRITDLITADEEEYAEEVEEQADEQVEEQTDEQADEAEALDYTALSDAVAAEVERRVSYRFENIEETLAKLTDIVTAEPEEVEEQPEEYTEAPAPDYAELSDMLANEVERRVAYRFDGIEESLARLGEAEGDTSRFDSIDENLTRLGDMVNGIDYTARFDSIDENIVRVAEALQAGVNTASTTEVVADTLPVIITAAVQKGVSDKLDALDEKIVKLTDMVLPEDDIAEYEEYEVLDEDDEYASRISDAVADEVERRVSSRLDSVEENIAKISDIIMTEAEEVANEEEVKTDTHEDLHDRFNRLDEGVARINEILTAEPESEEVDPLAEVKGEVSEVKGEVSEVKGEVSEVKGEVSEVKEDVKAIKELLESGTFVTAAEIAAAKPAEVEEEEQELVTVSDLVPAEEQVEEQPEESSGADGEDFLIDVLDMDAFNDDELMPGQASEYNEGVDFVNMMKYNRSFIARIIQSGDDTKQYYGEIKHALLSYRRVNSNVAWGNERFNKGRETIARLKIRGKTLCLYLALDPNNYKTSVYHHADVSDNKSVAGTPMMVKVKSPLGVRKAIRLIDEMLALRNGEKREIPERDYAAMYPYETIEELIDDGLVKDVRDKK